MHKDVGEGIARARNAADMTQRALGEAIGKSQQIIASYEGGTVDIPLSALLAIAEATGVTVSELFGLRERGADEVLRQFARDSDWRIAYVLIPAEVVD